jgi:hypothetical protein
MKNIYLKTLFFSCSSVGLLRSVRVGREGDVGYLSAAFHDCLPHDHQGEPPADGEDAANK